jgi:hypothetical protein
VLLSTNLLLACPPNVGEGIGDGLIGLTVKDVCKLRSKGFNKFIRGLSRYGTVRSIPPRMVPVPLKSPNYCPRVTLVLVVACGCSVGWLNSAQWGFGREACTLNRRGVEIASYSNSSRFPLWPLEGPTLRSDQII